MKRLALEALEKYSLTISSIEEANADGDVFTLTDGECAKYFLKLYTHAGSEDFMPQENVYHTYEQIQCEMAILSALAQEALGTAVPVKNDMGEWVTVLEAPDKSPVFAAITTYIDAPCMDQMSENTPEMAHCVGAMTAKLHNVSADKFASIAFARPHKRQAYMARMLERISLGLQNGNLTAEQFDMFKDCAAIIEDCMNRLDADEQYNVGLVHTDIRWANCLYRCGQAIPIDFSRAVYSYYLYDLGEMCAHMGGADIQREILMGYHSVRPFKKGQLYMVQVFFVMFLMMVMAEFIEREESAAWRRDVLDAFKTRYYPGIKAQGFFADSVLRDIREVE